MDRITRIGIDIDGVIRAKNNKLKTIDEYLAVKPLKNAFETIKILVKLFGNENIFIISRCPEYAENTIVRWLDSQKLFTDVKLKRSNVFFCRERVDKSDIAEKLKLTHFIDDRIDVLDAMKNIVANRILFTGGSNHHNFEIDNDIDIIDNWESVLEFIKR